MRSSATTFGTSRLDRDSAHAQRAPPRLSALPPSCACVGFHAFKFSFSGSQLGRQAHAPLLAGGSLLLPASPLGRVPQ